MNVTRIAVITHADGSRVSIGLIPIRLSDSVCLSVCLYENQKG